MKIALFAIAACGFTPRGGVASDASTGDGDAPVIDAAVDAGRTCHVVPMGSFTLGTGQLGNPGAGTQQPDLACMPNEVVVGVKFDVTMSNPPGGWNQHVAMATHAQCGTIALSADGVMHTTKTQLLTSITPQCAGWPPAPTTMLASCPDGDVLISMTGNEATKGATHSLFNSIAITCAPLDFHGVITAPSVKVKLMDSGNNMDQPQAATCPAGMAVTAFDIFSACGQDGLELQCVPTACM